MTFTLPAGQRAYNTLSPHRRNDIASLAALVEDKPWPVICAAASNIRKNFEVSVTAAPAIRKAIAENGALAVMALLERIGATPDEIDNPFQASLYRSCMRPEYQQAGQAYIRELGGDYALLETMETWTRNHPAEMG